MNKVFAFLLIGLLVQTAAAQDKMGVVTLYKNNREGQRKALVMGNQNYQNQPPLRNTLNDADSMAVALRALGFAVTLVKDKTLSDTQDLIDAFVESLRADDVAFVYYSGHGLGYQHDNYLMPIEFMAQTEGQVKNRAISTNLLRERIMKRAVRNLFLVVDACRNELAVKAGNGAFDLVPPQDNPNGTLLAFATDYGQTATYRSRNNKNSLYTESLLLYLRQPLELQTIFKLASQRTYNTSVRLGILNPQEPVFIAKIYDDYYFLKRNTPVDQTPTRPIADFLVGPAMVPVKGSTFQMGSNQNDDEKPVHSVTVSDFLIGKYEVTVTEYMQFVEETNSHYPEWLEAGSKYHIQTGTESYYKDKGYTSRQSQLPIVGVSWADAVAYCDWLSTKNNRKYRLPTEAEWEYAARGGQSSRAYAYAGGNDASEVGWTETNSGGKPHEVGHKAPNELGLYDLSGNVWEWCSDWYAKDYYASSKPNNPQGPTTGTYRVLRGGSWDDTPRYCRSANRYINIPAHRNNNFGFRVVSQSQ